MKSAGVVASAHEHGVLLFSVIDQRIWATHPGQKLFTVAASATLPFAATVAVAGAMLTVTLLTL